MKLAALRHWPQTILWVLALAVMPLMAGAQDMAPPPQGAAAPPAYTQQQIDQMVAQIALYPDELVSQILMAATYPLEVVEASRWLQDPQNAQLRGDQLAAALAEQPWDPSVKSLINFPQVLSMMDAHLQWTEQLGDAFLAQQPQVMDSLQHLRQMAEASGHLASTPQQTVATEDSSIVIEPANPQVVYVPSYNPTIVYGAWPYPDYEPYYFPYPGYYAAAGALIGFGIGIAVLDEFWGWNHWDWHNHRIDIDDRRFEELNRGRPPRMSGEWDHDPAHRHGVPYNSPAVRARYQGAANQARQNFRGYAPRTNVGLAGGMPRVNAGNSARSSAVSSPGARPSQLQHQAQHAPQRIQAAQQRQAPVFESFAHGADVRAQSQRGAYSRSTMSARPSAPARSAPSFSGGSRGGGGHTESEGRR